ncbi:MAG: hypothetical protein CL561_00335 [Alphaproteobacteria bacterium]|nr:hypothetical protein [Alphaproteobacteria bacterium]|tara:strand:+ start:9317 stop:9721 length:405 start_codon:yes stop_codon:yes gene_type:complete
MLGVVLRDGHYKDVLYKASTEEVNIPLTKGKPIPSWFKPSEKYDENDYPAKKKKLPKDTAVAAAAAPVDLSPVIGRIEALEDAEAVDVAPLLERIEALEKRLEALEVPKPDTNSVDGDADKGAADDAKDKGKKK